jgi:glyoxylase-like metal-dependent hydrolase (beta-lactamase superfamily II)
VASTRQGSAPWPPAVHRLESTRGAYAYLVRMGDPGAKSTYVLVDTGFPGRGPAILREIQKLGAQVRHIVVTHGDVDHVGNLAFLEERTGAQVWIPRDDAPYVLNGQPRPGIKRYIGRLWPTVPPRHPQFLVGGEHIGPLVAVPTPGHTPGHMAYRGEGYLLVGDALTVLGRDVRPSGRLLSWDQEKARVSARLLLEDYVGWLLPAHGEALWYPVAPQ